MEPNVIPPALRPFYFDFNWSNERVWAEPAPTMSVPVAGLEWHLDIPIWSTVPGELRFDLCPRVVLGDPRPYPAHDQQIRAAELEYPIDLMWTTDRLVILDGVHRLTRLVLEGRSEARVRRIPRAAIDRIRRL